MSAQLKALADLPADVHVVVAHEPVALQQDLEQGDSIDWVSAALQHLQADLVLTRLSEALAQVRAVGASL